MRAKSRSVANLPERDSYNLTTGDAAFRGVRFFSVKQQERSCRIEAAALFESHRFQSSYDPASGMSAAPFLPDASS
jgi:hypothetical protein